jgi:hypothetical protein
MMKIVGVQNDFGKAPKSAVKRARGNSFTALSLQDERRCEIQSRAAFFNREAPLRHSALA